MVLNCACCASSLCDPLIPRLCPEEPGNDGNADAQVVPLDLSKDSKASALAFTACTSWGAGGLGGMILWLLQALRVDMIGTDLLAMETSEASMGMGVWGPSSCVRCLILCLSLLPQEPGNEGDAGPAPIPMETSKASEPFALRMDHEFRDYLSQL